MAEYAVVAYLGGELARFAERLRAQLAPEQSHLRAHITLLPPRPLIASEPFAVQELKTRCLDLGPVRISVDRVETFLPLHPTVYLRVLHGARHLRSIYESLNAGALAAVDPWPYLPHLTLATLPDSARTEIAFTNSAARWNEYAGDREFLLREAAFVREESPDRWVDIESFGLGG